MRQAQSQSSGDPRLGGGMASTFRDFFSLKSPSFSDWAGMGDVGENKGNI